MRYTDLKDSLRLRIQADFHNSFMTILRKCDEEEVKFGRRGGKASTENALQCGVAYAYLERHFGPRWCVHIKEGKKYNVEIWVPYSKSNEISGRWLPGTAILKENSHYDCTYVDDKSMQHATDRDVPWFHVRFNEYLFTFFKIYI